MTLDSPEINKKDLTYVSLFSGAGIGCYGFKLEDFTCVATNELIERRLNIQKANNKCKYETGYILGDITSEEIRKKLFTEIDYWKSKENLKDIDIIVATPPCQGMSVANHKKAHNEINRNSLVIESIKVVNGIKPKIFIFENVSAFMKTACVDINDNITSIGEAIIANLGKNYSIYSDTINFKNYGACSSRTRTLVIGVRNDLGDYISPIELFPDFIQERTLRQTIEHLKPLTTWGEFDKNDIYHNFRIYPENMREWISELNEGQSAFDNTDRARIPHKIENGKVIYNQNKNGDKYKRQIWDKVGPCVHTRNDQLASQNTIHPTNDRVFSIRELMLMMTIPENFKWSKTPFEVLNNYTDEHKKAYMKKEEINIRQSIGEAVPTEIFKSIAKKIKSFFNKTNLKTTEINKIIDNRNLSDKSNLIAFISANIDKLGYSTLCKIAELANAKRTQHSAYFTNKSIITEIMKTVPTFDEQEIHILEPSVGIGNFIPFLIKKYENIGKVNIDVVDIDENALAILKILLQCINIPDNVSINYINDDFLTYMFKKRYNLVVGNPPFTKLAPNDFMLNQYKLEAFNYETTNTFSFFLEKALKLGDYVSMITPKFLLNTPEFALTREFLQNKKIDYIIDFGEHGFEDILVETICINVDNTSKLNNTTVISVPLSRNENKKQSYILDEKFPYWIIYRNEVFDKVWDSMEFNIFTVFRDRQITNAMLKSDGEVRVIKSRNINDDGTQIIDIEGYDSYIDNNTLGSLSVYKYFGNSNVYLTPNMTYNPRVMKMPQGVIVNGSVAILIPKKNIVLTDDEMRYFSSGEYREFYRIARNYQTRSLNIDSCSVYFFGRKKQGKEVTNYEMAVGK